MNADFEFSRLAGGRLLRRGYTTGSCAAAAAKAAAIMLLTQSARDRVTLTTPAGIELTLDVLDAKITPERASCAVRKDSGDDPDVTNGILVYAEVARAGGGGAAGDGGATAIEISGGEGVGRVTKPGLDQPVGAHAINSTPRRNIRDACEAVRREYGYGGGLSVMISVPGGAELAARTFNPRMGIEGGLSILGTTGIVEPMSEAAVAGTIRAELNLLRAAGRRDVLLTIGNYGEAFARDVLRLSLDAHVKCSNFIGESLAAAAELGFSRALLIGHVGKLVKLGIGITNTHSNHGDGRVETLLACALDAGADMDVLRAVRGCVSTDAALDCLRDAGLQDAAMSLLGARVDDTLKRHVAARLEVGFVCFRGSGETAAPCARNAAADKMLEVFAI